MNSRIQAVVDLTDEEALKKANLLSGDVITNYRTVASLSCDSKICDVYDKYLAEPLRK